MSILHHFFATPVGVMRAVSEAGVLLALDFADAAPVGGVPDEAPPSTLRVVAAQIGEWHAGERLDFDLPLAPCGTAFQRAVWAEAAKVPYGATITYAELAARLGRPGAARAVGTALGRNPFLLVVPCHRVLTSGGTLGGYAGGLARKRALLDHERIYSAARAAAPDGRRPSTAIITPAPAITRMPASAQPSGT